MRGVHACGQYHAEPGDRMGRQTLTNARLYALGLKCEGSWASSARVHGKTGHRMICRQGTADICHVGGLACVPCEEL